MKPTVRIEIVSGSDLKDKINSFYSSQGSKGLARDKDLYFLAHEYDEKQPHSSAEATIVLLPLKLF